MPKELWTENEFWIQFHADPNCKLYRPIAERLINWATSHDLLGWAAKTEKAQVASFIVRFEHQGKQHKMFQVWGETGGRGKGAKNYEILFQRMCHPFETNSRLRQDLRQRINDIGTITLPKEDQRGGQRPNFEFSTIEKPDNFRKFLSTFEWMVTQIKISSGSF